MTYGRFQYDWTVYSNLWSILIDRSIVCECQGSVLCVLWNLHAIFPERCVCDLDLAGWHSSHIVDVQRTKCNALMVCTPVNRQTYCFQASFWGSWPIRSGRVWDFKWFCKILVLAFRPVNRGLESRFLKTWLFTAKLNTFYTLPLSISQVERGLRGCSFHLLMWITFQEVPPRRQWDIYTWLLGSWSIYPPSSLRS